MKKLIVAIFVFTSSFLFLENVKADVTIDVNSSLINNDFFEVKELSEELLKNNNFDSFVIYYTTRYNVIFFNNVDDTIFTCNTYNNDVVCNIYLQSSLYYYSDNNLLYSGNLSNFTTYDYKKYSGLLYSNFKFKFVDYNLLYLNYESNVINVVSNDYMPLIYDLYLSNHEVNVPVNHEKELTILSNFYNLVIEKLKYLSDVIVTNYIYLSIIVVLLFFIVFEFLRRRLL